MTKWRAATKWRRVVAAASIRLQRNQIFIFPTRYGGLFVIMLLFMLIGSINYANSLGFLLTFLLASLFMVGILHTYRNLSGLSFHAGRTQPAFVGQKAGFNIIVKRHEQRPFVVINLCCNDAETCTVDLIDCDDAQVCMRLPTSHRGPFRLGPILIKTVYPLGLLQAWSWIDLQQTALVYPRPLKNATITKNHGVNGDSHSIQNPGTEDYDGLRKYVVGDRMRQIAWKTLARGQALHTHLFIDNASAIVWLNWNDFSDRDVEVRLSQMCYWVIQFTNENQKFGLLLPGVTVAPTLGERHKHDCLQRLALFNLKSS